MVALMLLPAILFISEKICPLSREALGTILAQDVVLDYDS